MSERPASGWGSGEGRCEQANDAFQFFGEPGIVADLETAHPMRFQPVAAPDATYASFADPHRRRECTRAPVSGIRRFLVGGHAHHAPNETSADLGGSTGAGAWLLQPHQAQNEEPLAPTRYLLDSDLHHDSHFIVLSALCCQQHDASTFDDSCRKRPAAGPLFQGRSLVGTQGNVWGDPHPLGLLSIRQEWINRGLLLTTRYTSVVSRKYANKVGRSSAGSNRP
jgi:hypothetical protein